MKTRLILGPILILLVAGILRWDYQSGQLYGSLACVFLLFALAFSEAQALLRQSPGQFSFFGPWMIFLGWCLRGSYLFLGKSYGIVGDALLLLGSAILLLEIIWRNEGQHVPAVLGRQLIVLIVLACGVAAMMSHLQMFSVQEGILSLGLLVGSAKMVDIGGYCAGKLIGKSKLVPKVSPNKSWEGLFFGLLLAVIFAHCYVAETDLAIWQDTTATLPALYGLVVGFAGVIGDLLASAFKREAGVKDSGRLLPVFGGAWDMIDSLCTAALVSFLFYLVMIGMRFLG